MPKSDTDKLEELRHERDMQKDAANYAAWQTKKNEEDARDIATIQANEQIAAILAEESKS